MFSCSLIAAPRPLAALLEQFSEARGRQWVYRLGVKAGQAHGLGAPHGAKGVAEQKQTSLVTMKYVMAHIREIRGYDVHNVKVLY